MAILFCACTGRHDAAANISSNQDIQKELSKEAPAESDPVASGFFNGTPPKQKDAWVSFIREGRFRIAQPKDFRFPAKAIQLQGNDIEKARSQPYVGGDINRDGLPNDFAAIVVDQAASERRFALVIFTQPRRGADEYEKHFLDTATDLSTTLLEWWSGGLAVRQYAEDGSYRYCLVKWDNGAQKFDCKEALS